MCAQLVRGAGEHDHLAGGLNLSLTKRPSPERAAAFLSNEMAEMRPSPTFSEGRAVPRSAS